MNDMELTEEIESIVHGLVAQQAMQDDWWRPRLDAVIAALRRGPEQWREVEPGHIFYAWLFEDGSFDWSLHAVEKYAREAADEEERTDPPDKIKVIPVRVVHAKPERPPSGEMVPAVDYEFQFGDEEILNEVAGKIPNGPLVGELRRSCDRFKLLQAFRIVLSAAEAEGRKPCPLCGRTEPHSHTSGPLEIS